MLDCGLPFAKIGDGGTPLVVFDGFRVEHRAADGLVLQGMINSYSPMFVFVIGLSAVGVVVALIMLRPVTGPRRT